METYRLLTANPGVIDSLAERPASGEGWRLIGDTDPDYLEQSKAQIIDPAGQVVGEVEFTQRFRSDVMTLIRKHEESRQQPPPEEPADGPKAPVISVIRIPTGQILITLWLSGAEYRGAQADEAIAIERGPDAMTRLREAVQNLRIQHPDAVVDSEIDLGELPTISDIDEAPPPAPQGPAYVLCLACGTVHRAYWEIGEVDRLHRQCDACYEEQFGPGPADVAEEVPVVFNPRLYESAPAETTRPDLETENPDPKPAPPPTEASESSEGFRMIPLGSIGHFPGGNQRRTFDPHKLAELAETIKTHGVIQPLTVNERDGQITLVAGERRLRAAGMAELTMVPCRVLHLTDGQAQEAMLIENLHREDLNPMDEAQAYKRLLAFPGTTQASVAQRVGKSRPHVVEYLQLLELPADMARQVASEKLSVKAALEFLRKTRAYPDTARELVAKALIHQLPSAREAGKVIDKALDTALGQTGVARATPPQKESTPARQEEPKQAQQTQTSSPPTPPAAPLAAPDVQTSNSEAPELTEVGGQMYLADAVPPQQPAQSPGAESDLAQIGRRHWNEVLQARTPQFEVEAMLTVEAILARWKERLQIKGYTGPGLGGTIEVQIPEQGVVFRGRGTTEVKLASQYKPEELQLAPSAQGLVVQCAAGRVQTGHTSGPVYYRVALYTSPDQAGRPHGGHKLLHQQVVIPDGSRHIVVSGSETLQIQVDQIPELEALVRALQAS